MHCQFNPETSGWSKTDSEGNPGLSVYEHCRHVGWVALELINQGKSIPHTGIKPLVAAVVAAIHDVGKWSPGFLYMCPVWLERSGLTLVAERQEWEAQKGIRHEKHSQDSIQLLLQNRGFKQSEATAWAMVAGAHHGKMHSPENYGRGDLSQLINEWHSQRHQIIETIESEFDRAIPVVGIKKTDAIIPWLMGLTSVADWIGSDEIHFPVDTGLGEKKGKESAKLAVESIGLHKPQIKKNLSFEEIFGFGANDMQRKTLSVITKPGVYVIEAPMGLGKTEAALACAYELLQSGYASGLYFALPTQLTSNRIHLRVGEFVEKITQNSDNTRLAHSNAWLEDSYYQPPAAKSIGLVIGKLDAKAENKGLFRVKTVHYTSKSELKAIAELFIQQLGELDNNPLIEKVNKLKDAQNADDDQKKKIVKEIKALDKKISSVGQKAVKTIGAGVLKDAADLALFGRMVANDHSLTIEGAAMFNHPISTHKVDNELDFFAAVDDWQKEGESGAGMTGTLEFNSSVYYRFAALNLDMLSDKEHLACMTPDERKKVVSAFVQATLEAVPGMTASNSGRKNSMNGYTRPSYVLGIVREKGHPIQFVNAFEEPVWAGAGRGIMKASIEKLQKEEKQQNTTWKLNRHELVRANIPYKNVDEFIKEMVNHVE